MKRLSAILVTVLVLFGILSFYRERLIPRTASSDRRSWLLTGDEPCYLLAAQAAARGDGLDMRGASEARTYLAFQKRAVIAPEIYTWEFYRSAGLHPWLDRSGQWGRAQIRHHLPLYPFLIAPWTAAERIRWAVACFQAVVVCAVAFVLLWTFARTARKVWLAALVLLPFLGGLPAGYYTTQMYPETLAGAMVALAMGAVLQDTVRSRRLGYALLFVAMWVSPRVMGGVAVVTVWELGRQLTGRRQWGDALCFIAGWAGYCGYHLVVWGLPLPPAYDPANQVTPRLLPIGLVRSLLANDIGLLFLNPALWVGFAAAVLQWVAKPSDRTTVFWTLFFLGTWAGAAMLPVARAGMCPAGRYQVILAYLLVFPAWRSLMSEGRPRWRQRLLVALAGLVPVAALIGYAVGRVPNFWFRAYHPLFGYPALQRFYGLLPDPKTGWFVLHAALWLGLLAGLLFLSDAVFRKPGRQ